MVLWEILRIANVSSNSNVVCGLVYFHVFGINIGYGKFNGVVGNSEKEFLAHFGPTDNENFDEALSNIVQIGTLRDYRCEFKQFMNCGVGWPKKALIDTFMGGT
jgi:hypothetical protein